VLFTSSGIVAVGASQAAVAGLFSIIGLVLATRLLGVSPRRILGAMWPPLAATAAMSAVVLAVDQAIEPAWPSLIAGGLAGAATYLGVLWLVAREALRDLRAKLRPARPAPPSGDLLVARETDVIA
jgi:hypothetical protein